MTRLTGLPPVVGPATRLVVLGSFPGAASLAAGQYYAHPRNQFWPIVTELLAHDPATVRALPYAQRCEWLVAHGLGVWDVYATCEREGSLDTAIRNAQPNPLERLRDQCPALRAIAHNGGESFKLARVTAAFGWPVIRLPSTSPANASWSLARKQAAWREAFAAHGLL